MAKPVDTTPTIESVLDFIGIKQSIEYRSGDSGPLTVIPTRSIFTAHPELLRFAIYAGLFGKLGNISKGGLSKQLNREATDADLAAARLKAVEAWANGDWNISRSGPRDSLIGDMKRAFLANQAKKDRDGEKMMAAAITEAFGKDGEKLGSFTRYLDALATIATRDNPADYQSRRDALEEAAANAAREYRDNMAKAADAIEVNADALFA